MGLHSPHQLPTKALFSGGNPRKEGMYVTRCVLMMLTKNGAIINLSLGLGGGVEVQNKLYD